MGEVTGVHPDLLRTLVADGYIPVLATVAADSEGQALNVNADIAAGEVPDASFPRILDVKTPLLHRPTLDALCNLRAQTLTMRRVDTDGAARMLQRMQWLSACGHLTGWRHE